MEHIYFCLNQELGNFEQELLTQAPKQDAPDTSTLEHNVEVKVKFQ
ncbi:hypothetical protein SAMN05443246_1285 [Paenibacillus sp. GP183]|nr:hypothetical protein SAMN05443246_1285 [Paenibacillus sp. GP183]